MHMKDSMSATIRRQRLPEEDRRVLIYQHHVTFTEVLSESMPQVALHCLVLSEYGLNMTNPWSVFSQLSSLATSLICLVLAFGKVSSKSSKTIVCQIHILFITATSFPEEQESARTLQRWMLQRSLVLVCAFASLHIDLVYDEPFQWGITILASCNGFHDSSNGP